MTIKTIFLDRDGVINKEVNYLHKIESFEFIDGVFSSCIHFQSLGYQIIIITNQSGISRGYFNDNDYQKLTSWMFEKFVENGIKILDIFYCPHGPESNCNCRKPRPGMFIDAKNKHKISMNESWMIGDSESDIKAANLAGVSNTILVRSGNLINETKSCSKFIIDSIRESKDIVVA